MIDLPLKFSSDENPELVILTQKQKQELLKKVNGQFLALSEVSSYLEEDKLQKCYKNTLLSLIESYCVDLFSQLDYDSHLKEEKQKRHEEVRSLNLQNRELRRQLGEKVSPEDVRENLKNFVEKIKKWWEKEGLGYIPKINFQPYFCEVEISGRMSCHFVETQPDFLRSKGYILRNNEKDFFELEACDSNTKLIEEEKKNVFLQLKFGKYK